MFAVWELQTVCLVIGMSAVAIFCSVMVICNEIGKRKYGRISQKTHTPVQQSSDAIKLAETKDTQEKSSSDDDQDWSGYGGAGARYGR